MTRRKRRRKGWRPPPLTVKQILTWADGYHDQAGRWPNKYCGWVDGVDEKWSRIDGALAGGYRGLTGGTSLAQLLAQYRGVRNPRRLPPLTELTILKWADEHHRRTGSWPNYASGPVLDSPGDSWLAVDSVLRQGHRGLPGGSSLARLLAERRGVRNLMALPRMTVRKILSWVDAHRQRTGDWPHYASGLIPEAPGETWLAVDSALRYGQRGLPGGSSLAKLLDERRDVRNIRALPPLTIKQVLTWADAHHRRTGRWPTQDTGPVAEGRGETWKGVQTCLQKGGRGLPGGSSLARVLARHRGVRNLGDLEPLTLPQILRWADAHRQRTGAWPQATSGTIPGTQGETWMAVQSALQKGSRGLPGGSSLARVLVERRHVRSRRYLPKLTRAQILKWAQAHVKRTGRWPTKMTGAIPGTEGETWSSIENALRFGTRGLPGGSSLYQFLSKHGAKRTSAP